ncbi:Protein-tyrosine phosphatase-like [Trinorchestia longiramus]|nr:Protein-tyrosine phosphatase-like [Trinorchestia longiramus]
MFAKVRTSHLQHKEDSMLATVKGFTSLQEYPENLRSLFDADGAEGSNFRQNTRNYNSAFAFASFGANIRPPPGHGPHCFRLRGQTYHYASNLHADDFEERRYGQLYILETNEAIQTRANAHENANCLVTPPTLQCSVFCGGSRCRYENADAWPPQDQAIDGIYSHWITPDILAMARPNADVIEKKNIVQQFQEQDIRTIINLQTVGEHASCGGPLLPGGFSYDPNTFMENNSKCYDGVVMKRWWS